MARQDKVWEVGSPAPESTQGFRGPVAKSTDLALSLLSVFHSKVLPPIPEAERGLSLPTNRLGSLPAWQEKVYSCSEFDLDLFSVYLVARL